MLLAVGRPRKKKPRRNRDGFRAARWVLSGAEVLPLLTVPSPSILFGLALHCRPIWVFGAALDCAIASSSRARRCGLTSRRRAGSRHASSFVRANVCFHDAISMLRALEASLSAFKKHRQYI